MLDSDLVEQSGDLHGSAYLVQEMDRDPVYRKNLAFLRSVRGVELESGVAVVAAMVVAAGARRGTVTPCVVVA